MLSYPSNPVGLDFSVNAMMADSGFQNAVLVWHHKTVAGKNFNATEELRGLLLAIPIRISRASRSYGYLQWKRILDGLEEVVLRR